MEKMVDELLKRIVVQDEKIERLEALEKKISDYEIFLINHSDNLTEENEELKEELEKIKESIQIKEKEIKTLKDLLEITEKREIESNYSHIEEMSALSKKYRNLLKVYFLCFKELTSQAVKEEKDGAIKELIKKIRRIEDGNHTELS